MTEKLSDNVVEDLIRVRRHLHRHPELSNHEVETSRFIFDRLKDFGLEPQFIDETNRTGVFADIDSGKDGPRVIYRSDIDALPVTERTGLDFASENEGVMHACGHDFHMTVLLGTARELIRRKDEWRGKIRVVFQEGEENFTGARKVIERGLLDDMDYAIAVHTWPDIPAGTMGLRKGPMMASTTSIKIIVKGSGGHGAHPHRSIDPIVAGAHIVTAVQTIISRNLPPMDSAVITFGTFHAGKAGNVIPDEAVIEGTFRTLSNEAYELLNKRLPELIEAQARSFGATAEVILTEGVKVLNADPEVVDVFAASADTSIGEDNLRWLPQPSMGSEDFSLYLDRVPGALVRLGTSTDDPQTKRPLHHAEILFDEKALPTGVAFMTQGLIDLTQKDPKKS